MHIEKNICESLFGTLLNIPGKSKDRIAARMDMKVLRPELVPNEIGGRTYLSPAHYTLKREEKCQFCQIMADVKVPE